MTFRDEDDAKIGTAEKESDDDSDDENIPEPEVGEIEMSQVCIVLLSQRSAPHVLLSQRSVPHVLLSLRGPRLMYCSLRGPRITYYIVMYSL